MAGVIPQILRHVGIASMLGWTRHFLALGLYTLAYPVALRLEGWAAKQSPQVRYRYRRWLDAFKFGSGRDYVSDS